MADNQEQYAFYQIPHVGLTEANAPTKGEPVQSRDFNMKMSNFGALWIAGGVGRSSADYTKVKYGFEAKGQMEGAKEFGLQDMPYKEAERDENPLVWGGTVKYTRDDQMFKMTMSSDDTGTKSISYAVKLPAFDVMDTNLVDATAMVAQRNYPTEGWRSFGGKYDFLPYAGGGFTH